MSDKVLIEAMARGIYERRHRGMKNVWPWDDSGLDDEHPGVRERIIADATAALAALRKTHAVVETKPVLWRVKDYGDGWIIFKTEQAARALAEEMGALMQPLYPLKASEATDA